MRHKIICFLLGTIFHLSTVATATVPAPKEPLDVEKELRKVANLTDGLEILFEVYSEYDKFNIKPYDISERIGKNYKKIMEASKKCGIILRDGIRIENLTEHFKKNNEKSSDWKRFEDVKDELSDAVYSLCHLAGYYFDRAQAVEFSSALDYDLKSPFKSHCRAFFKMIENPEDGNINIFKATCKDTLWYLNPKIFMFYVTDIELSTMKDTNYIDNYFENFYKFYRSVIRHGLASNPMCYILNENAQSAFENGKEYIEMLQSVNKRFKEIYNDRKEKYWSKNNIARIVKKFILDKELRDEKENNGLIASRIYHEISENYKSLGYEYHVGVSNSGTNGNVDTLIQCSTECHYFYEINNKDVYIIRNKKTSSYKECNFLSSESQTDCGGDRDSTDLTELAKEIQSNCNPTAFSLVRRRLKYGFANDNGFAQKCVGDISAVMAQNF